MSAGYTKLLNLFWNINADIRKIVSVKSGNYCSCRKTAQIKVQQEIIHETWNISFEIFDKQCRIQCPKWSWGIHHTPDSSRTSSNYTRRWTTWGIMVSRNSIGRVNWKFTTHPLFSRQVKPSFQTNKVFKTFFHEVIL